MGIACFAAVYPASLDDKKKCGMIHNLHFTKSSFSETLPRLKGENEFTGIPKFVVITTSPCISTKEFINMLFCHFKINKFVYFVVLLRWQTHHIEIWHCQALKKLWIWQNVNHLLNEGFFLILIYSRQICSVHRLQKHFLLLDIVLINVLKASTIYWVQRLCLLGRIFASF